MPKPPSPFQVSAAFKALQEARARLLADAPHIADSDDDTLLLQDMLEGEADGDPLAVIDRLVEASVEAASLAAAAKARAQELSDRGQRFRHQQERLRGVVLDMLTALDLPKLQRAAYTASVRPGKPHVVITDADAVPPDYVRIIKEPNRAAIGVALECGQQVPGAALSNATSVLTIRVS